MPTTLSCDEVKTILKHLGRLLWIKEHEAMYCVECTCDHPLVTKAVRRELHRPWNPNDAYEHDFQLVFKEFMSDCFHAASQALELRELIKSLSPEAIKNGI
jgi:hypothetical protein